MAHGSVTLVSMPKIESVVPSNLKETLFWMIKKNLPLIIELGTPFKRISTGSKLDFPKL